MAFRSLYPSKGLPFATAFEHSSKFCSFLHIHNVCGVGQGRDQNQIHNHIHRYSHHPMLNLDHFDIGGWETFPRHSCGKIPLCSGPLWGTQRERVGGKISSSSQVKIRLGQKKKKIGIFFRSSQGSFKVVRRAQKTSFKFIDP